MKNTLATPKKPKIDHTHIDNLLINKSLAIEIDSLRNQGYAVNFDPKSERTDTAYNNLEAVVSMFERLRVGGQRYEQGHRKLLTKRQLGAAKVVARVHMTPFQALAAPFRKASLQVHDAREVTRREILYSSDKMPWHNQSGQAMALLTIAFAHELESEQTNGIYPTMSGLLGDEIFAVTFDKRSAGFLKGKTMEEANIAAGQRFHGKSLDSARVSTRKRIQELHEFIDQPISEDFKQVVQYCTDSLGIRSRKDKVREVISQYVDERMKREPKLKKLTLLSVGCGTALPIFEVAKALKDKGIAPTIILLDQDPIALAAAQCLAEKEEFGLGGSIELHCRRLFSKLGSALDLSPVIQGRKIDIVEDTGLREYLPPRIYKSLTRALWKALASGGIMSTGNMSTHRPQPEFLHGLMGWIPVVRMRDIATGFLLHEASGVPKGSTTAYITSDGVYTLYISRKQ